MDLIKQIINQNPKIPQAVTVDAKINVMSLKLELERVIKAANAVFCQQEECRAQRYSSSSKDKLKLKMYDLKKAVQHAETELKKKQTELFS